MRAAATSYRAVMRYPALIAVAAAIAACSPSDPSASTANEAEPAVAEADGAPKAGVDRAKAGSAAPATSFVDADGKSVSLASFKGQPVLLNLWASWCAPCVKELPTLAKLSEGNAGLKVLTVSQDSGPQASVKAFLAKLNVPALGAYHDPDMRLSGALNAQILPTSVLYDADGREVWRYTGDLDWTGEEAVRLLGEAAPAAPAKG